MIDYKTYRESPAEQERIRAIVSMLPPNCRTALDAGCRDGYIDRVLVEHLQHVTALDLQQPQFSIDRVLPVRGDITALQFPDRSFDLVCCFEVLEHIGGGLLPKACAELARVARHNVLIGVPYKQDLRSGRTTCASCGGTNPPWGHVNTFDEARLKRLFPELECVGFEYLGRQKARTNAVSAALMNLAGNPWGAYDQEEPCIHCGEAIVRPPRRSLPKRLCSAAAVHLNEWQSAHAEYRPVWIHGLFARQSD